MVPIGAQKGPLILLRPGEMARAVPPDSKRASPASPLDVKLMPVADRVVVKKQSFGSLDATPSPAGQQERIGAAGQTMHSRAIARQLRESGAIVWREKTGPIIHPDESSFPQLASHCP